MSVTLFAVKINILATVILANIHTSLFFDDLQITYQYYRMTDITTRLQNTIEKITAWATRNGFKVSKTNTVCMKFYKKSEPITNPDLKIQNHDIPVVETTKFLGLIWDNKLTWAPHIEQLKRKCRAGLYLMRTISRPSWGANQETLMRTYGLIIRPKLDYG